jgi:hypothetical protein
MEIRMNFLGLATRFSYLQLKHKNTYCSGEGYQGNDLKPDYMVNLTDKKMLFRYLEESKGND